MRPGPLFTIFALAQRAKLSKMPRLPLWAGDESMIDRCASMPPNQRFSADLYREGANANPRQHFLTLIRNDCAATALPIASRRGHSYTLDSAFPT